MRMIIFLSLVMITIIQCRFNTQTLKKIDFKKIDFKWQYVSLDSFECAMLGDGDTLLSKRIFDHDELSLAKIYNIDISKQQWICDLEQYDISRLTSNQFLLFKESCLNHIIENYDINIEDLNKIILQLNKGMVSLNSEGGQKYFQAFEKHFLSNNSMNKIEYCRVKNLTLLIG